MEIFILVITFLIGINLGWNAREMYARHITESILSKFEQLQDGTIEQDVIYITIELDSGMFYAYHKESSVFITQANTREKLEKQLAELFPDKRFGCTPKNLKECGFIK
jgi:hypothetical protein